jgi:deoxyribonuclease-4
MFIGPHISIAKGYQKAVNEALSIGADTFQFFTRNPRGGKAKDLDLEDISKASKLLQKHGFGPLLAHAPYTMNLASANVDTATFGKFIFADDLERLKQLPCEFYNFHPGSHVGQGVEKGIDLIVGALNEVLTGDEETWMLLETMSGKGSEIGRSFEEINAIIKGVKHNKRLGVCLDTCHVYSAGYDIVDHLDEVLEDFDRIIGLQRLKAIHLNDSMKPMGSNKDRHEKIGKGTIGKDAIDRIVNHPKLSHIPFYLETPNELEGYQEEIAWIRAIRR